MLFSGEALIFFCPYLVPPAVPELLAHIPEIALKFTERISLLSNSPETSEADEENAKKREHLQAVLVPF